MEASTDTTAIGGSPMAAPDAADAPAGEPVDAGAPSALAEALAASRPIRRRDPAAEATRDALASVVAKASVQAANATPPTNDSVPAGPTTAEVAIAALARSDAPETAPVPDEPAVVVSQPEPLTADPAVPATPPAAPALPVEQPARTATVEAAEPEVNPARTTTVEAPAAEVRQAPAPVPNLAATTRRVPAPVPADDAEAEVTDDPVGGARLIRPYAMTGGRTEAHSDISLESQIQTSTRLDTDGKKYRWEAAKILKLAERPMALVELAARAEIPIGVARVVISDLVDEGAVHVQRTVAVTSYTSLLEKVLDGIRDL